MVSRMKCEVVRRITLGKRPVAVNNLNGESFQQDNLVTHNGWQYCGVYIDHQEGQRRVQLSRRELPEGHWESIIFDDYTQTEDDGHNVICLGICHQDGSMHLSWDLHSSVFNYRQSLVDLVSDPQSAIWSTKSFGPVEHSLHDLQQDMSETTYPRFLSMPRNQGGALLLDLRTGISGLGDEWLFVYTSEGWRSLGVYLKGVGNNAYINGLDIDHDGTLHVTWCYRDYVDAPRGEKPQQAGPNGPENNHDLYYAYSPPKDGFPGRQWFNSKGDSLLDPASLSIEPRHDTKVFDIPKHSGILNQEAQCVNSQGVHVLNRENINGVSTWFHYLISGKEVNRIALRIRPASSTSARGKLVSWRSDVLALIYEGQDLVIIDLSSGDELGRIEGAGGPSCQEVLYDRYRNDRLSLFVGIKGELIVLDLDMIA